MPNSTFLFPLEREQITLDPNRVEPVFWLRRLVLLSALNSSDLIRDIEFRRGLNIIRTHQMDLQGGPVAGHSVGKTLLMRLIRFSLGELHFGTDETEYNVAAAWKTGYVVTHWSVAGSDWIVVRPMRSADAGESFATRSDDWKSIVDLSKREHPHREFIQAVSDAVLSGVPTFNLPRGREARWLDVLAWLSRDYQCGYRKANDWRHEDANSGPSLDREENSFVMQWIMGLMGADEIDLRIKHYDLLNRLADQKRSSEREEKKREILLPSLLDKLELQPSSEIVDEQTTFDSIDPVKTVADTIASLERLKKDQEAKSPLAVLQSDSNAALKKVNDAETSSRSCHNMIKFLEKQLREYERDPLAIYSRCQAKPVCWIREKARETASDPAAEDHMADFRSQLDEQKAALAQANRAKKAGQTVLDDANQRVKAEQERLKAELSRIDERIGRWKGFQKDAQSFHDTVKSAAKFRKALGRLNRKIDSSSTLQTKVRRKHRGKIARLKDTYQDILRRIFGREAVSKIRVDGNGLQPVPDKTLAPSGAALSVMTVLAFDIACIAASMSGTGHHSRFLMHDSPREGDMEAPLFRKLFDVVYALESQCQGGNKVSFQYIVTTTTAPPDEYCSEDVPYVRETLDARHEEGLLLKKRF